MSPSPTTPASRHLLANPPLMIPLLPLVLSTRLRSTKLIPLLLLLLLTTKLNSAAYIAPHSPPPSGASTRTPPPPPKKFVYCGPDWSSFGPSSKFIAGPCLKVSGIGATQTPNKTIIVIDRTDYSNSVLKLSNGATAFAEELNLQDGSQRGLDVLTNTFCSSGQYAPDGALLVIGGPGYKGAGFTVRRIIAGGNFSIVGRTTAPRWYPTTQLLPDGRVLVVGGNYGGSDINYKKLNIPTLEYYPRGVNESSFHVEFLESTLPYNLYPFVHLLPSGRVFLFASHNYILWDTTTNMQVGQVVTIAEAGVFHSYPLSGTTVMFPLTPGNNFSAEIMICGGGPQSAKWAPGVPGNINAVAHQGCHRIKPEDPNPTWSHHKMSVPRVMPTAVLLPDGTVLIVGGAQTGYAGIPNWATKPTNTPELFSTIDYDWVDVELPTSNVTRVYHSSAFLLHDATVFLSGSNPNNQIYLNAPGFAATNFRTEIFFPPYLSGNAVLPKITKSPSSIPINTRFKIRVVSLPGSFKVVLCHPGFSTHGANHGMRSIELPILFVREGKTRGAQLLAISTASATETYDITISSPPNKNVSPPTFYWLFVLLDGRPSRDGIPLYIRDDDK